MLWFKVWFGLAAVMLVLVIVLHPQYQTVGLCFLAWLGGIAFDRMVLEQGPRLFPHTQAVLKDTTTDKTGDDGDH